MSESSLEALHLGSGAWVSERRLRLAMTLPHDPSDRGSHQHFYTVRQSLDYRLTADAFSRYGTMPRTMRCHP